MKKIIILVASCLALYCFYYFDIYQRMILDAREEYLLADRYQNGFNIDQRKAEIWYLRSAKQGYRPAQKALGFHYSNGLWGDIDNEKAIYWYSKAAEQGSEEAKLRLLWLR